MKTILRGFIFFNIIHVLFLQTCFAQGIEIPLGGSITNIGNSSLEVSNGNFINNGTFTMGTGVLSFSGTTNGNISGSSNYDFYNLSVDNSNGVTLSGIGYVAINNVLAFTTGLVNTGSNNIIINDNATVSIQWRKPTATLKH